VLEDVNTWHEKLVQSLLAMRVTPLVALAYLQLIKLWVKPGSAALEALL
jgi:hypothetical protein